MCKTIHHTNITVHVCRADPRDLHKVQKQHSGMQTNKHGIPSLCNLQLDSLREYVGCHSTKVKQVNCLTR